MTDPYLIKVQVAAVLDQLDADVDDDAEAYHNVLADVRVELGL